MPSEFDVSSRQAEVVPAVPAVTRPADPHRLFSVVFEVARVLSDSDLSDPGLRAAAVAAALSQGPFPVEVTVRW
jgi:hypothetical protein